MPLARSEGILRQSRNDAFLRHWDVLSPASPWPRHKPLRRYWYVYRRFPGGEIWLRRLRPLARLLPGVHFSLLYGPFAGRRALRHPWRHGYRCYGGWAWGALRREAARYILEALDARPDLLAFYRRTMSPEESVLQTLLCNAGRFSIADDDLRYIDYRGTQTGSPRTLDESDIGHFASGRYAFARKFDLATCRPMLDRIDRELLPAR